MTVTVEVPEEMVAVIQRRGQSVPEYLVQAADHALGSWRTTEEERRRIIELMLTDRAGRRLDQSIRSAIDEGRRY